MSNFRKHLKTTKLFCLRAIVNIADALSLTKKYLSGSPGNCLIISATGIGDTIWGTPAIREFRKQYPEVNLCALTKRGGKEILSNNPNINRIYLFKKGILYYFALLRDIRKACFDTVIIFHATDRIVWLLAYLTGAGKIIGSDRERHHKGMDFLMTSPVHIEPGTHAIYLRLLLMREFHINGGSTTTEYFVSDQERSAILKKIGKEKILVGFQPGSARLFQRWPEDNFAKLGKLLKERYTEIEIIVTGSSKERKLVDSIAGRISGISLAGLSIRDTAAWMERCSLFISNDTGPMHISVALGTPTIALCAATGTESCEPYKELPTFASIEKQKPCDKCESKSCEDPVCMEQITPKEVFEKACEMLSVNAA
jgi:ADP-heptose:LPS heptosyltransferase